MWTIFKKKVLDTIKKITKKENIFLESHMINDIGISSLDYTMLIVSLERKFKIRFENDFLMSDAISDVKSISDYIAMSVNQKEE